MNIDKLLSPFFWIPNWLEETGRYNLINYVKPINSSPSGPEGNSLVKSFACSCPNNFGVGRSHRKVANWRGTETVRNTFESCSVVYGFSDSPTSWPNVPGVFVFLARIFRNGQWTHPGAYSIGSKISIFKSFIFFRKVILSGKIKNDSSKQENSNNYSGEILHDRIFIK